MVRSCHFCGGSDRVERHHIDGNIRNNDDDNLLYACRDCHEKIHHEEGEPWETWRDKMEHRTINMEIPDDDHNAVRNIKVNQTDRPDTIGGCIREAVSEYVGRYGGAP